MTTTRNIKPLFGTEWESLLRDDEIADRQDGEDRICVVLLAGLQRLAREAGIISQSCTIITPFPEIVQAVFTSSFLADGQVVSFVGTADASRKNTSGKFLNYPTAVAESRAEARSLRKALGIRMLSSEEIGLREGISTLEVNPNRKADDSLIRAIELLIERNGFQQINIIDAVIQDAARASEIFTLSQLTTEEAQRAMAWLNEQKPVIKITSKKEERDARKQELLAKQGNKDEGNI